MAHGINGWYPTGAINYPYNSLTAVPANNYQPQQPTQLMYLVNSEQEASSWNVLPGNSLFFMDSNNKLFYIKSVDFSGISSFRKFKFEELGDGSSGEKTNEFITREEFESRLSSLNTKNFAKQYSQKKGEKINE